MKLLILEKVLQLLILEKAVKIVKLGTPDLPKKDEFPEKLGPPNPHSDFL